MGRRDFRGSPCASYPFSKHPTNCQFSGLLGAGGGGIGTCEYYEEFFFPPLGFCFVFSPTLTF